MLPSSPLTLGERGLIVVASGKVGIAGGDFQGAEGNLVFPGSSFPGPYVGPVAYRNPAIQMLMNGHHLACQHVAPAGFVELPPLIVNPDRVVLSHYTFGLDPEHPIQIAASTTAERVPLTAAR